jgi:DNA sulfur modification protein DndD
MRLGAGDGNIKTIEDIVREEGELKQKADACERDLAQRLGDRLPLHLIDPLLRDRLEQRLKSEDVLIEWQERKQRLDPDRLRFTDRFFRCEPVSHIVKDERNALQQAIDESWESLYWPRPEGCADVLLHGYLERRQRQRLAESQAAVAVGSADIRDLIGLRERIQRRLKELETQRLQLQGVDEDGTLRALHDELKSAQQALSEQNRQLGDLERQKTALDAEINRLNSEYQRENQRYLQSEPAQSVARKAECVRSMINDLLPRLFQLKVDNLSECVSRRFRDMAHRNWIDRIEIDPSGASRLIGQDGSELRFDPSAGENQIFATALFAGLADVSGYHIPLVVDTPLARLDSMHRENLLAYWRSDPERQVILLSQDKEIDASLAEMLEGFVANTWLLESQPIGSGLYRTGAREGYFGGDQ